MQNKSRCGCIVVLFPVKVPGGRIKGNSLCVGGEARRMQESRLRVRVGWSTPQRQLTSMAGMCPHRDRWAREYWTSVVPSNGKTHAQ